MRRYLRQDAEAQAVLAEISAINAELLDRSAAEPMSDAVLAGPARAGR